MKALKCPITKKHITQLEFNLKNTLINGQAFNWVNRDLISNKSFRGILGKNIIDFCVNDKNEVLYSEIPSNDKIEEVLTNYLQLEADLTQLSQEWCKKDAHYASIHQHIKGVRILRQFPFECMISFICSQNNNIPRITKILKSLREKYGDEIYRINTGIGEDETTEIYYSFPTLEQLSKVTESDLKLLGLGYRASYIVSTVKLLQENGGEQFLFELRGKKEVNEKRQGLLQFKGIGNKVADCISLFSLDAKNLIPVDTHVFQIYNRVYRKNRNKDIKLTKEQYSEVQTFFQKMYGDYAGWAHQAIFAAELPSFQEQLQSDSKVSVKNNIQVQKTKSSKSEQEVVGDEDQYILEKQKIQQKQKSQQIVKSTTKRTRQKK